MNRKIGFEVNIYPPYAKLNDAINQNYSVARAWYSQREIKYKAALVQSINKGLSEYENNIKQQAQNFMKYVQQNAYNVISAGGGATNLIGANFNGISKDDQADYEKYLSEILKEVNGNSKMIHFSAGRVFEDFMASHALSQEQVKKIYSLIDAGYNEAANYVSQAIGKLPQVSAVTKSRSDSRTDVMTGKFNEGMQIELTSTLDINEIHSQVPKEQLTEAYIAEAIESLMIKNGESIELGVHGFQLKTYSDLKDNRWMGSSIIAKQLQNIYNTEGQIGVRRKTLSTNYDTLYPVYFLSRQLLNVINPVNIGIIYANGIEWMSSFLERYRFYMDVTFSGSKNPSEATAARGGGLEMHPKIANSLILMHQISGASGKLGVSLRTTKTTKTKTIKVATIRNL